MSSVSAAIQAFSWKNDKFFRCYISTLWYTGDLSKISGEDIVTKLFSVRYS